MTKPILRTSPPVRFLSLTILESSHVILDTTSIMCRTPFPFSNFPMFVLITLSSIITTTRIALGCFINQLLLLLVIWTPNNTRSNSVSISKNFFCSPTLFIWSRYRIWTIGLGQKFLESTSTERITV